MSAQSKTAKACASLAALSLGACSTYETGQQWPTLADFVVPTEQEMRAYVAENWSRYAQDLRHSAKLSGESLEFVDLGDLKCGTDFGNLVCNFEVAARTESGELARGRLGGMFERYDGRLEEVEFIIVG